MMVGEEEEEEEGKTHAVRSVPFRQTGLASGFQVSATKTLTIGEVGDGVTHCRF